MECRATWNDETIAVSDKCILTEGNLYFPPDSVKHEFLRQSDKQYTCRWKGQAGYFDLVVNGKVNKDAAWYYYAPSEAAMSIKDYVAFDKSLGVKMEGEASNRLYSPWEKELEAHARR
ncbi:MAG: DUF427 domain-containing protein [Chloroflexi bacterium]|nr:DUF427 domain-containing protein [Chloroflexota bacterium]